MRFLFIGTCLLALASLKGDESAPKSDAHQETRVEDVAKISEAFGHLIGKNLQNAGFQLDVAHLMKGLKDSAAGVESPMTEQECIQALTLIQEKWFKKQSETNLKEAIAFLEKNAQQKDIYQLDEGKVQYRVDAEGDGATLEEHFSPLVRYSGKFLDGSQFVRGADEETLHLDEIIPGLKAGLLGMKEGEKRTIFIHPDLAYGVAHFLPPNALLTFEVELIKANAPAQTEASTPSDSPPEIAGDSLTTQ